MDYGVPTTGKCEKCGRRARIEPQFFTENIKLIPSTNRNYARQVGDCTWLCNVCMKELKEKEVK